MYDVPRFPDPAQAPTVLVYAGSKPWILHGMDAKGGEPIYRTSSDSEVCLQVGTASPVNRYIVLETHPNHRWGGTYKVGVNEMNPNKMAAGTCTYEK